MTLGLFVLIAFCDAIVSASKEDRLEELRGRISSTMHQHGPHAPELKDMFESMLELDPHEPQAMGALAVHHLHVKELDAAVKMLLKLESEARAAQATRTFAKALVGALELVIGQKVWKAVVALRRLAAVIFLNSIDQKDALHQGIENEVLDLTNRLWDDIVKMKSGPKQGKTPFYTPGLLALPFWPAESFDLALDLQGKASKISLEVEATRNIKGSWKPVGQHTHKKDETILRQGSWKDILIWGKGKLHKKNCKRMPTTCELVKKYPEITTNPTGVAMVSELGPGSEIASHAGQTNAELTFHLGLRVPAGDVSGLRVAGVNRTWTEGRVLAFDDSFEHEVWHRGAEETGPRTVLLVRFWHPELSPTECQVPLHMMLDGRTNSNWEEDDIEEALRYLRGPESETRWRDGYERAAKLSGGQLEQLDGAKSRDSGRSDL